jgi:hypothetical protein
MLSLETLADALQTAINSAGGGAAYTNALVSTTGSQLLVMPGTADTVTFDAAPGDDRTVTDLQLHARFAVRVRLNGAESLDPVVLELPQ